MGRKQGSTIMDVRQQRQLNPVADEVLALTAVVRPILKGVLYALKQDVVAKVGGYEKVDLVLLSRLYRAGDGDCGICFEYAVHEAMTRGDPRVIERVSDAIKLCRIYGTEPRSILFGLEKSGTLQLIDSAREVLTNDSRILSGRVGQPPKLRKHLNKIVGAFRNVRTRPALPYSIRGLWKADLVVGDSGADQWVGTTVKINPNQLQSAAGLRIGIIPSKQGRTDRVQLDMNRNLVVCPLHHDEDFMQAFYEGWRIIQAFIDADAEVPREVSLPRPDHREVARILAERRNFPVLEVIEAIAPFAQPELLDTKEKQVDLQTLQGHSVTDMLIAPLPRAP
jgi:hypothetical protein